MKRFGAFTLDTVSECLWRDGKRISLPPKPFAVLRYLVEHAARLVTHDELLDALWPDTYVQPQVLRTYMLDLRRILEDDAREPRFIQSHPKRGYSFLAAVTEVQHPAHDDSSAAEGLPGRERELAILNEALRKASVGRRQVVFLCGESGIGKTALVDFFSRRVECEQSGVVARGQCVPGLAGMQDFYPISDALRQLGDTRLHIAVPPSEVCASLEQIGEGRLLVLLLEDLQWADESTIAVLSALARRRGPAKLLIVAALVPQASSAAHAVSSLIQDLQIRGLCTEISLNPLSRRATLDLLRQHLVEGALPEALKDFVHDYSEGNPRIALAILDHVIAEKILVRREFDGAPQWELCGRLEEDGAAIPSDLARMVDLEMERLTPYEQSILEAASLVPVAFAAWMVAAALGDDVASVEECCDKLTKRVSIVKRAGEDQLPDGTQSSFYVFAHTFYRNALYRRQSPARRRARHIRVAERLRKLFRSREEFIAREAAAHYEAAGDLANAIAMLKVAAVRALKTQAFGEAADLHHHIACLEANSPIESWRPTQNNSPNELTRLISGESPSECDSTSVEA